MHACTHTHAHARNHAHTCSLCFSTGSCVCSKTRGKRSLLWAECAGNLVSARHCFHSCKMRLSGLVPFPRPQPVRLEAENKTKSAPTVSHLIKVALCFLNTKNLEVLRFSTILFGAGRQSAALRMVRIISDPSANRSTAQVCARACLRQVPDSLGLLAPQSHKWQRCWLHV